MRYLDAALEKMEESIREGVAEDIMRITIERFKTATVDIAPYMEDANVTTILKSIKDTSCMALMPQTSDHGEKLEAMMPKADLPRPTQHVSTGRTTRQPNARTKRVSG